MWSQFHVIEAAVKYSCLLARLTQEGFLHSHTVTITSFNLLELSLLRSINGLVWHAVAGANVDDLGTRNILNSYFVIENRLEGENRRVTLKYSGSVRRPEGFLSNWHFRNSVSNLTTYGIPPPSIRPGFYL